MKPHKCTHCKVKFETEERLNKHIQATHNDAITIYTCEICQKQFQFKGSYTDHLKSHAKDDIRYECTECPCFFKNHGHLKSHIKDVHGAKPKVFNCKECSKKFDNKSSMTQHIRKAHASEQAIHKCTFCQRIYGSKNSLKWHTHINHNKDYVRSKCPYCPSDFKWPHHLKVHIRKAHIEKGHAPTDLLKKGLSSIRRKKNNCVVCDEKFEKKLDLMLHLKSVHKQELDIYKCCLCTAVFSLMNSLKFHLDEHRRKDTKPAHRCEQCYPEPNPILYTEEKNEIEEFDGRSEIEKEIIDFELTLMEDEDIRRLIRYRLKHSKKKHSIDQEVFKAALEDSDFEEFDLFTNGNGIRGSLSDVVSVENCADSSILSGDSLETIDSDADVGSVEKIVKICLERVTHSELKLKHTKAQVKQCNLCKTKFKLQHSLNEHRKSCPHVGKSEDSLKLNPEVSQNLEATEKGSPKVIERRSAVKLYKCKFCTDKFTKPINLGRHMRLKHGKLLKKKQSQSRNIIVKTKQLSGAKALKSSPKRPTKAKPIIIPDGNEKLYECGKCALYFKSKLELLRHISEVHMAIQPKMSESYFCDYCNGKFATRALIIEHLKTH